jgi:FKBP-type peptidyl-prolyl cis-trans isomerase FkpA
MKHTLFTLLVISVIAGLVSCKKNNDMVGIKEYDNQQILKYISANGITGMVRDTAGGDTTGIYYKIIQQGTGPQFDYPDSVAFSYTLKSFDGKYSAMDTVTHHFDAPLGHVVPNGLQLALHNVAKFKGTKVRLLIPSHLAYGIDGTGSGSSTIANARIAGNQCLDYTVYLINDRAAYDDMVIANYIAANNLTGYTKLTSGPAAGMWYKITVPPTGPNAIDINSSVSLYYTGALMDNSYFDDSSAPTPIPPNTTTSPATFADLSVLTVGFRTGLLTLGHGGGSISMLVPSRLGYGNVTDNTIPPNSCLRFEAQVTGVTNAQ